MLGVSREAFDESRARRQHALARRLIVRVWVREYRGQQADLARHFRTSASIVSRWHSRAVAEAQSHGALYDRIVEALPQIEGYVRASSGEDVRNERKEQRTTVNVEIVREE